MGCLENVTPFALRASGQLNDPENAMSKHSPLVHRLYRSYLRGAEHPAKLRILRQLTRILFPDQGIPFEIDDGIWMYLHPRWIWEYHLLKGGRYQPNLCRFMQLNVKTGETVAIAGASFGQQVILASRAVGASGHVIAVDPHPAALVRARQNIALNDPPNNIWLVGAALGERSAIAPISAILKDHVGEGSLIKPPDDFPYYVLVDTLPAILRRLGIDKLDVLCLDVIGCELPVLGGLQPPFLPKLITVAVHPWVVTKLEISLEHYQQELRQMGYSSFALDGHPAQSISNLRECQLVGVRNGTPRPVWLDPDPAIPGGVWM
jgi:FkbM family methyltransferase